MDCRNYYRRYLKKVTTKNGQSGSITIPKWKYAEEMSFVRQYLRERDNVTYSQFEENYGGMRKNCYKQRVNMEVQRNKRSRLLQVQKLSSKTRSTCDGIRSTDEIFG
jgi:hypothetical protein